MVCAFFKFYAQIYLYNRYIAIFIRRFLDSTKSQLTYYGLFHLATSLPPNTLCAVFRNSHLSVLYKYVPSPQTISNTSPPTEPSDADQQAADPAQPSSEKIEILESEHDTSAALYSLVTDQVFLREPCVVWERVEDVDGGWSTFVDSDFVKSSPAGGDFAGQTAEEALRAAEAEANERQAPVDLNEYVFDFSE